MTTPIADLAVVTPSDSDHVVIEQGGNARKSLVSSLKGGLSTYTTGDAHFIKVLGSEISADSRDFNFGIQSAPDQNLPGDTRGNVVVHMGWNMNAGGTREDVTDAAFGISFEQHYLQGGVAPAAFEWHLQGVDTSGNAFRTLSAFIPKDGSSGTIFTISVNRLNIEDHGSTQRALFDFATGQVDLNSLVFRHDTNNTPIVQQRNAADSAYLDLPYFNAEDALTWASGFRAVGATPTTGTYANVFAQLQASSLAAGGVMFAIQGPAVTGASYGYRIDGNSTTDFIGAIRNGNTEATAHAVLELRAGSTAAGDALVRYNINGGTQWQVGVDNSDSDTFKWGTSALGSADKATLTTGGDFAVIGHVKTAVGTVASLPAAATAGAGARRFVTDSNGTTFAAVVAGGGANGVPVYSDGTNWRIG